MKKILPIGLLAALLISGALNVKAQIITTIAGNGYAGYSGDGGTATAAQLYYPLGETVDAKGNLYIADQSNSVIRKINTNGIISTVAGNGTAGYSGDGGLATAAELNYPASVSVDAKGNLYIADRSNNVIRKVDANGIITTIAGNGNAGYSGDGSLATSAELNETEDAILDAAGNLYISDLYNNVIRKVNTKGIITTVAGNGNAGYSGDGGVATAAQLNGPIRVTLDNASNLYIADANNNVVRKVGTNGIINTIAGNGYAGYSGDGGPATSAQFSGPVGLAVDAKNNLYVADFNNNVVRKISTNGIINTIAGNGTQGYGGDYGPATFAELNYPNGIAIDAVGNLYIADEGNNVVRKVAKPVSGAGGYDLTGIWDATGYQCPAGTYHQEQVQITTSHGNISATKLIGDDCVPAGNVTFNGAFDTVTQEYDITWTDGTTSSPACCSSPGALVVITIDSLVGAAGTGEIITFVRHNSLPLNLLSFTGSLQHNTNILNWQTTQEINTQSFTVQRSGDGANFTAIGSVPAADAPGTNNYTLTDTKPLEGANYYRLKMFDKDGAFTYSGIVELNNSNTAFALQVYPNPAASSSTLRFNSVTAGKYAVTITSSDGKTIKRVAGTAVTGTNTQQLDISGLAAGVYMVTFTSADGTHNLKLVKQ